MAFNGKYVEFGGTDEYADAGAILGFEYNEPFSVSCWFKTSTTPGAGGFGLVGTYDYDIVNRGYGLLIIASGQVQAVVANSGAASRWVSMPHDSCEIWDHEAKPAAPSDGRH